MYDATRDTQRRGPLTQTYFAYGSNLDAAQMRARCPSAKLLGAAILDGYRLGFAGQSAAWGGGVATVVRDGEGRVPGLLWALSDEDLERLDRFEGATEHRAKRGAQGGSADRKAGGVAYERRRLLVTVADGARRRAHVYVKDAAQQSLPTEAYFGVLWRAYRKHGFDELALAMALGGER